MSSCDNGGPAGAEARLSKPAIISRLAPTTSLFPRLKFDFIAEYLSWVALLSRRKHHYL